MSLLLVGKVLGWFEYEVTFSVELMKAFVKGVENQAERSISQYHKGKETHFFEEYPEENYCRIVETYQGLNSESVNLDDIFCDYFPSLQRSSAFLTLYAFFEHELDNLCLKCKNEKSSNLSLDDLSHKGIERATIYLQKVIGINVHRDSNEWRRVLELRSIRNLITHQAGNLTGSNGASKKEADYLRQMGSFDDRSTPLNNAHPSGFFITFKTPYQSSPMPDPKLA